MMDRDDWLALRDDLLSGLRVVTREGRDININWQAFWFWAIWIAILSPASGCNFPR